MAPEFLLKLHLLTVASFVNRDQSRLIAYLLEEKRIFRDLQSDKRPRLTDDQRRRFAAKGKPLTAHCHEPRLHPPLANNLIAPTTDEPPNGNRVVVDERLDGLLSSYRRSA